MQNSSKPFPHNLNPIYLDTTNWVLRETIQTKKTAAKKNKKKCILCLAWADLLQTQLCSVLSSASRGKIYSKKKTKTRSQFLCKNCYDLWNGWNQEDNPIIKSYWEWVDQLKDQNDNELEINDNDSSDGDFILQEDEEKVSNLRQYPSYNEEEFRIHLLIEKEKRKELMKQKNEEERVKEQQQKKDKKEKDLNQLKKNFCQMKIKLLDRNLWNVGLNH
ncbi:hypothetical protein M0813_28901 [Anaeramoeba flamelloides]|uniref:Uncharacterized protein n=1 Tax=Anaeramoeba flamelloides TaxID=1746091 RepID=A0ABQ8XR98_9EUKA|nr:hypothetical protein M0813_28901 [Anaeramoeba flamelloides]